MRHANDADLDQIESLLATIRQHAALVGGLVERKRGIFYLRGRGFLHFHVDNDECYADLKVGNAYVRFALAGDGEARLIMALSAQIQPA